MIAEKLERQLDWLEALAVRNNGDVSAMALVVVETMRVEVERVRALEESGVLVGGGLVEPVAGPVARLVPLAQSFDRAPRPAENEKEHRHDA